MYTYNHNNNTTYHDVHSIVENGYRNHIYYQGAGYSGKLNKLLCFKFDISQLIL